MAFAWLEEYNLSAPNSKNVGPVISFTFELSICLDKREGLFNIQLRSFVLKNHFGFHQSKEGTLLYPTFYWRHVFWKAFFILPRGNVFYWYSLVSELGYQNYLTQRKLRKKTQFWLGFPESKLSTKCYWKPCQLEQYSLFKKYVLVWNSIVSVFENFEHFQN